MCPMRIFVFLGSIIVIAIAMYYALADDGAEESFGKQLNQKMRRKEESTCRWFASLWTGELLYRVWPVLTGQSAEKAAPVAAADEAEESAPPSVAIDSSPKAPEAQTAPAPTE